MPRPFKVASATCTLAALRPCWAQTGAKLVVLPSGARDPAVTGSKGLTSEDVT
jgi:hypothetical protein